MFVNFQNKYQDQNRVIRENEVLLGYPVAVVPIRFWTIEKVSLTLLGRTIADLVRAGVQSPGEAAVILGLSVKYQHLVEYEWKYLDSEKLIVKKGGSWIASQDGEESYSNVYKDGYLIFDQLRGSFFPYVHERDYYKTFEKHMNSKVTILPKRVTLNQKLFASDEWGFMARQAAAKYTASLKKELEDGESGSDLLVNTATVEDSAHMLIELKPYAFIEEGWMIVSVRGELFNLKEGTPSVSLRLQNPINGHESPSMLEILLSHEQAKQEIDILKEITLESAWSGFGFQDEETVQDLDNLVMTVMEEKLAVKVTNEVMEYLDAGEREYQKFIRLGERNPGKRSSFLNTWNLAMEAFLKEKLELVPDFQTLEEWKSFHDKMEAKKYLKLHLYQIWEEIPPQMQNVTAKQLLAIKRSKTVNEMWIQGNRDRVAMFLLKDLAVLRSEPNSKPYFLNRCKDQPQLLRHIDRVVEIRNQKGGHYDAELTTLDNEKFKRLLDEIRNCTYSVINHFTGGE